MGYMKGGKSMVEDKEKYFKEAEELNKTLFQSKEETRKIWAKQPIEVKIKELIRLQEITAALHPELRNIIPWRMGKTS